MFRTAFFLLACSLLAVGCSGSDIAGKASWADWPASRDTMISDGNGP